MSNLLTDLLSDLYVIYELLIWQQVRLRSTAAWLQGGRGGGGVRLWLSHLQCRSYLLSPGLYARTILISLIYHKKIIAAGAALIIRPPIY